MPNQKEIGVTNIKIMDREFKIKCPEDDVVKLQEAATYLDNKMREVARGDKFVTIDRVAVAAALNITHDLMLEKQRVQLQIDDSNKRLLNLKNKLCRALANIT